MIKITRYKNRKLYNTSTSKYITLPGLLSMVKNNIEFIIIEKDTSKNVTVKYLKNALFYTNHNIIQIKNFIKDDVL